MPTTRQEPLRELVQLTVREISAVDAPATRRRFLIVKRATETTAEKAEWTTEYINDLPDSSFALILPGGEKDETGRTVPRSLRKLPYKDRDGKIDLPHLRNALARLPLTRAPQELKERARRILERAAAEVGVGDYGEEKAAVRRIAADREATMEDTLQESTQQEQKADAAASSDEKVEKLEATLSELQKRLAEAEARAAELAKRAEDERRARRRTELLEDVRKRWAGLGDPEQLTDAWLALEYQGVPEDVLAPIRQALTAAAAQIRTAGLFHERGHGAPPTGSVADRVTAEAEALRKREPSLTKQQAIARVYAEHPEWYLEELAR